jgi:hypothetical protein
VRVERLVLAGGSGEIPAVQEHVAGVDHVDRLAERHATDVREIVLAVGRVRVVEECLDGVGLTTPGADGVIVDRRTRRQRDPRPTLKEGREPLDEVTDDVTGNPARHGRRLVPRLRRGALDVRGERTGDPPVLFGRGAHRSSAIRASSLA